MTVSSYSAINLIVTFAGVAFTGFADGDDVVTVDRNNASMTQRVGIQGDAVYSQTADKSGKITIKLLQNSETNSLLTAKIQASEAGAIVSAPLIVTETGSDAKVTAMKCVIEGQPTFTRGANANTVEWVFLSADISIAHGTGETL